MKEQEFVEWPGEPRVYRTDPDSWGVLVGARYYEFTPTGHLSDMGKITQEHLEKVTGSSDKNRGFLAAAARIRKNMANRTDIAEAGDGKQRKRRISESRQTRTDPDSVERG